MEKTAKEIDPRYMARAIELARHGLGYASPNPMVGAVIVADGRIIGEGWHRRCGQGHAEVNAVASVSEADRPLLRRATIYVTLEPCSHYGKTPPCAKLLIDNKIPRVVVGMTDPFSKVSGRGIAMLREAGAEVTVGVMEDECRAINPAFLTAHTLRRPYVTLKWAESADGFIASADGSPVALSTPLGFTLSHRLRTLNDAIMVGATTVNTDNPSLTPRLWPGRAPQRVVASRHGNANPGAALFSGPCAAITVGLQEGGDPEGYLRDLYRRGITSVIVEGGARLLQAFIDSNLWDAARVERSGLLLETGIAAPRLQSVPATVTSIPPNTIFHYINPSPVGVSN